MVTGMYRFWAPLCLWKVWMSNQNCEAQTQVKTAAPERGKNPENVLKPMVYLVFSRQVGSNAPGSLVSNRVHQQVSP